jgi:amino acid transporter
MSKNDSKESALKREFSLSSAFAFAFAFISPIVALYGIFGLALTTAGPSFWWAFPLVFCGQLLVALVFSMLVSRWPLEGSIYQWSRQLLGEKLGWFAGWAYLWTLVIAMATVALGAAGFLADIFSIPPEDTVSKVWIAFGILVSGTVLNMIGRGVLKVFMMASIVAEVVGSLGLGTWLLMFHRHQSLNVLTSGGTALADPLNYLTLGGPFLVAVAFAGWSFVGFESAGAIAEEVQEPSRDLPKAIIFSLVFIAIVVMYSALAIILAIPDISAVLKPGAGDPVLNTLTSQLGPQIGKPVSILFVVGFVASFLALQTSASRVIWAYARDEALPFSKQLVRLSSVQRLPITALIVTLVIGSAIFLISNYAANAYMMLVNFTTGGFYVAFLFPLIGALIAQLRGRMPRGGFSLGVLTTPVMFIATVWASFQFINIAWPRAVNPEPYLDWSVWIGIGVLTVVGAVFLAILPKRGTNK